MDERSDEAVRCVHFSKASQNPLRTDYVPPHFWLCFGCVLLARVLPDTAGAFCDTERNFPQLKTNRNATNIVNFASMLIHRIEFSVDIRLYEDRIEGRNSSQTHPGTLRTPLGSFPDSDMAKFRRGTKPVLRGIWLAFGRLTHLHMSFGTGGRPFQISVPATTQTTK